MTRQKDRNGVCWIKKTDQQGESGELREEWGNKCGSCGSWMMVKGWRIKKTHFEGFKIFVG